MRSPRKSWENGICPRGELQNILELSVKEDKKNTGPWSRKKKKEYLIGRKQVGCAILEDTQDECKQLCQKKLTGQIRKIPN